MSFDLQEQVILVTGGGGFLALEFARALGRAGARPVLADVDHARADENAAELRAEGLDTISMQADITSPGETVRVVEAVVERLGQLDGLLNGAAIDPKFEPGSAQLEATRFEDYPLEQWNRSLAVNLTGTFLITQAATRHFLAQNRGVIVNVSSIYGMTGPDQRLYADGEVLPPPRFKPVDYSVTKSALYGFTRYLAAYLAGTGVRANAVTFGGIEHGHDDGFRERYGRRVPLGRMGEPSEVGGVMVFLFSEAASYMTGSNVVVDGGWTAW
jgi:NAD(P)-dependent dehydrogenase (short-subunit alcohol dehydrogenase family)